MYTRDGQEILAWFSRGERRNLVGFLCPSCVFVKEGAGIGKEYVGYAVYDRVYDF